MRSNAPLALAALLISLFAMVTVSVAQQSDTDQSQQPGMGMMDGQHLNRVLDQVQATPEQRSKVTALMTAARKDLQAQHQAGRDLQQRLMLALTQPTVDSKAVEALRLKATRLKVFKRGKLLAETPARTAALHLPGRPAFLQ